MTASRKQTRTDLKAELAPFFTSLQSTDDFYRYEPAKYDGKSPVVFLRSVGAGHPRFTKALDSDFFIEVHLLALYADLESGAYGEEAASDLLDDMENQLSTAVEAKRKVLDKWQDLSIEDRSEVTMEQVGGDLYLHEAVTLRVRMY